MPVDFIKKNYEPDVLIVHGTIQKEILTKHLGWSKKEIVISNSFRYTKKAKKNFLNKIYLPISLVNKKKLKLNIKKFFQISKLDIKQFQIINHPIMVNSSNHLNFIKEIKKIKFNNKVFKKLSKNKVIVIGVSAVILEMLENNLEVIHICSQPIYEKHSSKIWHSLISRKLSEGVYSYKLKNRGTLIKFGKKNFFQKKYKIY